MLQFKVKKSTKAVANLSNFLRLSQESPDHFIVRKLVRVIEEFLRNHYLKSFGYQKKCLDDIKLPTGKQSVYSRNSRLDEGNATTEYEYYYDEEEPVEE